MGGARMTPSPNRARLSVDLRADWREIISDMPARHRALGTVTRAGEVGVLVIDEACDTLMMLRADGSLHVLPSTKAQAALDAARAGQHGGPGRGQGRRPEHGTEPLTRCLVSLDAGSIEALRNLGDGNLSRGIRRAATGLTPGV